MKRSALVCILGVVVIVGMVCFSCRQQKNEVVEYLEGAELQYDGDLQKENIIKALNDALHLPPEILRGKRYRDYQGNEAAWDLRTVVLRHFVPNSQDKMLGPNFYPDITAEEGRKRVAEILEILK